MTFESAFKGQNTAKVFATGIGSYKNRIPLFQNRVSSSYGIRSVRDVLSTQFNDVAVEASVECFNFAIPGEITYQCAHSIYLECSCRDSELLIGRLFPSCASANDPNRTIGIEPQETM